MSDPRARLQGRYRAYHARGLAGSAPTSSWSLTYRPGDLVAFDNRRVLHGRTGLRPRVAAQRSHRRGIYADRDDLSFKRIQHARAPTAQNWGSLGRDPASHHVPVFELTGHGGLDKLESIGTDLPVPQPGPGEVLVRVTAAGMNNTDINTRTGWYSQSVSETGTTPRAAAESGFGVSGGGMGAWSGDIRLPAHSGRRLRRPHRRPGTAGRRPAARVGERVVCDPYLYRSRRSRTGCRTPAFSAPTTTAPSPSITRVPTRERCHARPDRT